MGAEKVDSRPVHGFHIDWESVQKGILFHERVFLSVDEILVFPHPGVESGMEFRVRRNDVMNLDSMGQDGIYFVAKPRGVKVLDSGVEVCYITYRIYLRIGPASPCDGDFFFQES